MQCHSVGMHRQRELIAAALKEAGSGWIRAIYDKSAGALPGKYGSGIVDAYLWHEGELPDAPGLVTENGVQFMVDWVEGQKTGFFLDQRENRQLLTRYTQGKTVLNTFCYTGGFSAYALKSGSPMVHSVDVSARAMELTARNVLLNTPYQGVHEGFTEDVLRYLKDSEELYDVVVVDPPAFAKTLEKRHNAVQGYKRLNAAAMQRVRPGGILFTFSCSQVIDRALFYNTMVAAALEAGRNVRVLHHLSQGADHPVSLFHPEGSYLKGLVLYVE
jgi:23S rRNA (cytosine1962-C5)-methyltransferase